MEQRQRLAAATSLAVRHAWLQIDRDNIQLSWMGLLANVLTIVSGGQLAAARAAEPWLQRLLGTDPDQPASDRLSPGSLVGVSGDGRPMAALLIAPMWTVLRLVTQGAPVVQSMARGQLLLDLIVRTAIADTGRAADTIGMVTRPAVTAYVRVVEGGACSRCLVLAGREYSVSKGFDRHPRCHCSMDPVTREHKPTPTSVETVFKGMSDTAKKKAFGEAGVKAIDAGADIAQVVNARRGMATATAFGRKLQTTTEGVTRRGIAGRRLRNSTQGRGRSAPAPVIPRLMPEEILRQASDREHAIRLLRQHAYIV